MSWIKTLADGSFTVAGPRVCNMLPSLSHSEVSYMHSRHLLKGHYLIVRLQDVVTFVTQLAELIVW